MEEVGGLPVGRPATGGGCRHPDAPAPRRNGIRRHFPCRANPPAAGRLPICNHSGSILLWVVCSLFLLSTVLVLVTSTAIRAAQARRSTRQRLVALGIAEREMERLKAAPFDTLPADGRATRSWRDLAELPQGRGWLTLAPAPHTGMRQVTVRVEWQERGGAARSVELTGLRSPHG